MLGAKAPLQSHKEVSGLLGEGGVNRANELLKRALESRNLLERLVQKSLRPFGVGVPQVVDGDHQAASLLFNHVAHQLVIGTVPVQWIIEQNSATSYCGIFHLSESSRKST